MRIPPGGGPLRWCAEIGLGLYRPVVLTGLTCVMPAAAVPVGVGGSELAYSWSSGLQAPLAVRALAALGETLVVILWIAVAIWVIHPLTSRGLAQAARRCAKNWLGVDLQ